MKAIATELSGARAFNNVVEIAGYEYDRKSDEYGTGTYREAKVVERLAREYGFSNVRITRLPTAGPQWDGEDAELWVTAPEKILVSRYLDHPAMFAYGSRSADVTAQLVWIGHGLRDVDYAGKDVKGKIVLTDWAPGPVHDIAVKLHGAAGDSGGREMQTPIVDPQGTQDPFHIRIMKHAGGSDHLPFLRSNPRVAGVHYMNWPDVHYHTSEDLTKFLDPTQLKRAAMITMCVSAVMANASQEDALMLAGLTSGHAVERIGTDLAQAMEGMRAAGSDLDRGYKEGLVLVRQAYRREVAAVRSNAKMMEGDAKALASLREIEQSVAAGEAQDVARLQSVYTAIATGRKTAVTLVPPVTAAESAAAKRFPRPKGGDPYVEFTAAAQPSMNPGHREFALYDEEARNFADGTRSVLEIRDAISAELGPIDVERVDAFFRDLEKLGKWEILSQPPSRPALR